MKTNNNSDYDPLPGQGSQESSTVSSIYAVSYDYITVHAKRMMHHLSGLLYENAKLNTAFDLFSKIFPGSLPPEQGALPADGEEFAQDEKIERLVASLEPLFKYDGAAKKLANYVVMDDVKDYKITDFVNQLAAKGVFLESTTKADLWKVLYKAGVYQAKQSTFNEQVEMPRSKK